MLAKRLQEEVDTNPQLTGRVIFMLHHPHDPTSLSQKIATIIADHHDDGEKKIK